MSKQFPEQKQQTKFSHTQFLYFTEIY